MRGGNVFFLAAPRVSTNPFLTCLHLALHDWTTISLFNVVSRVCTVTCRVPCESLLLILSITPFIQRDHLTVLRGTGILFSQRWSAGGDVGHCVRIVRWGDSRKKYIFISTRGIYDSVSSFQLISEKPILDISSAMWYEYFCSWRRLSLCLSFL